MTTPVRSCLPPARIHPHFAESKTGDGSVYSAAARFVRYDAREEEARRGGEYGYYPSGGSGRWGGSHTVGVRATIEKAWSGCGGRRS